MKPRLLVIFALIVIVPLAVLGWLGAKLVRDEQTVLEHRFSLLMENQLRSVDGEIANVLERWQRDLRTESGFRAGFAGSNFANAHGSRRRSRSILS